MAERITGGQCQVYISSANTAAANILPSGLITAMDSFDIDPSFTYEDHNEINNPRTTRQQTAQTIKVSLTKGVVDDTTLALSAGQSANFLNKGATPKYHIRIVGNSTTGANVDRWAKWCTLDDEKVSAPAGNKTMTQVLTFTAEEVD